MLKKLGIIFLVTSISVLLSSCHIKQKDVETIKRTTDNLRIYQPGNFIVYDVITRTNSFTTTSRGTLRVQWDATADLLDPIDTGTQYTVLKETTTLIYEPDSTATDVTIIRYISQDSDGNITLYAIGDGDDLYWLYKPEDTTPPFSSPVTPLVIFDSPIAVGSATTPVKFSAMEGCGVPTVGLCGSEIYTFDENEFTIVGDSTSITTGLGEFSNPFQIRFNGINIPKNSPAISIVGDIRDACGTSLDSTEHNGIMFVMPEIGIVQMTNQCQNLTGQQGLVNYTITINNTNIPLPTPTP
ncbi:MAG: hypothetical protein L3J84_08515 [Gammaproteobacteria bacterium]|nr:hypothetical protein [Gammaproteobacteria bacterium]